MYDPKTSKVEHLLKERGYWEGGPNSSIFSPSLMKVPAEQVGSGPISAVSTPFENTLQEQLKKLKLKAPAMAGAGTGAGLALWPADAPGYVNRNSAGGMSYLNDGKVSPFSGGREGDVMRRTVCEPTRDDGRWGERCVNRRGMTGDGGKAVRGGPCLPYLVSGTRFLPVRSHRDFLLSDSLPWKKLCLKRQLPARADFRSWRAQVQALDLRYGPPMRRAM